MYLAKTPSHPEGVFLWACFSQSDDNEIPYVLLSSAVHLSFTLPMKLFGIPGLISGLLTIAGIVLVFTGFPLYAAIAAVAAFALNGKEIKSYSTFYQFINFRVHTLLLGYAVDLYLGNGTWWYTLMMG